MGLAYQFNSVRGLARSLGETLETSGERRGTIAAMARNGYHCQVSDPEPARDCDSVPENMCLNCGTVSATKHQSLKECVAALRDELATLQLSRPRAKREA